MSTKLNIEPNALARLFSARVLRELATIGRSPLFACLVRESRMCIKLDDYAPISKLYDMAFNLLQKPENRCEYVYKATLTNNVLLGKHSLRTAAMLSEFRVDSCKADIVILNGTSTVYEIKSERDNLRRLERQIQNYSQVFASINVIVGENHFREVYESVPEFVGILTLTSRRHIRQFRTPTENASRLRSEKIFDSITLREAQMIMESNGITVPDVPNSFRYRTWRKQFERLAPSVAHSTMVETLKKTRNLEPLESILVHIPKPLYFSVLSSRLKLPDRERLVNTLRIPARIALNWS